MSCETKIAEFDFEIFIEEYVKRLEIAVNDFGFMEVETDDGDLLGYLETMGWFNYFPNRKLINVVLLFSYFDLCSISKRFPFGRYSVIMHKLGGLLTTPINRTIFG